MPQLEKIAVARLLPPSHRMRDDIRGEDWEEFKESIAELGLIHPITVRVVGQGYEIVCGDRRSLAHIELGLDEIMANVYLAEEPVDLEKIMAHENGQRKELDPIEEGRFYARQVEQYRISASEVARRNRKPISRVSRLIDIVAGDPAISEALRVGRISQAQAEQLNLVSDAIGREQMLHYATANGLSADFIRRWREQRESAGLDKGTIDVAEAIHNYKAPDTRHQTRCEIHNAWVQFSDAPPRTICYDCWQLIPQAMMALQKELQADADVPGVDGEAVSS